MELKEQTLDILKNYSSINPNLLIKESVSGKTPIRTIDESRTVFSTALIDEEIPVQFGIYDLNEFITSLSLIENPSLSFEDTHVLINDTSGKSRVKYFLFSRKYSYKIT